MLSTKLATNAAKWNVWWHLGIRILLTIEHCKRGQFCFVTITRIVQIAKKEVLLSTFWDVNFIMYCYKVKRRTQLSENLVCLFFSSFDRSLTCILSVQPPYLCHGETHLCLERHNMSRITNLGPRNARLVFQRTLSECPRLNIPRKAFMFRRTGLLCRKTLLLSPTSF